MSSFINLLPKIKSREALIRMCHVDKEICYCRACWTDAAMALGTAVYWNKSHEQKWVFLCILFITSGSFSKTCSCILCRDQEMGLQRWREIYQHCDIQPSSSAILVKTLNRTLQVFPKQQVKIRSFCCFPFLLCSNTSSVLFTSLMWNHKLNGK